MTAVRRLASQLARGLAIALPVGAAAAVLVLGGTAGGVAPATQREFNRARAFRAELVERAERPPATAADTAGLVALGYLERARLGVGSPFRLVDFALADPRLPDSTRRATAWTILAMIYDGDVYQVDPAALDSAFATPVTRPGGDGLPQLRRMERVVAQAGDPRAGELAVRLAYRLAEAERLVRSSAGLVAARAAAQLRDRDLARDDLFRLLRAAREDAREPLGLVTSWRATRRFEVERPVLATADAARERQAVQLAPALLAELRRLAQAPTDSTPASDEGDQAPDDQRGRLLSPRAASHLAALPQVRSLPPRAPVVIALSASRERVLGEDGVPRGLLAARERLADASTEEALVAEYARLGDRAGRRAARATLWAATAMRTYGQEEPWFPGAGGPSAADLKARYGLASVSFDRDVPAEWRPYYRRQLAAAVSDLQRVLPAYSVKGLGVHFGRQPLTRALAVHDPRTRTVFLPLGTGAGALAHELAHDLDWQVAARSLGRRGEYSTDAAVREQRGRMAASLQGLSVAALVAPGPDNQFQAPHALRPTEVFAGSVDWYVAAALAREGRLNGSLTAVQDELFTGFAGVRPPDVHGDAGDATIEILREMGVLPAGADAWFRASYGRGREVGALDRAERVLELATGALRSSNEPPALFPRSFVEVGALGAACVDREQDHGQALVRRRAVELAAESVARRRLAEQGVELPGGGRVPVSAAGVVAAPVDPDLVTRELRRLRNDLLAAVHRHEASRGWLGGTVDYRGRC